MSYEPLFDGQIDLCLQKKPPEMGLYEYLNKSSSIDAQTRRAFWESVSAKCPTVVRKELRTKFVSDKLEHHIGAVFELFLLHFFTTIGYQVDVHPTITPMGLTPDFMLSDVGSSTYVEGKSIFLDLASRSHYVEVAKMLNEVNRVLIPQTHWFSLRFDAFVSGLIDVDETIKNIRSVQDELESGGASEHFRFSVDVPLSIGGVSAHLMPVTLRPDDHKPQVLIPFHSGPIRRDLSHDAMKKHLKKKATKYKRTGAPFVLALNLIGGFPDDESIMTALFGDPKIDVTVRNGEILQQSSRRAENGFWWLDKGPSYRNIIAVLICKNIEPFSKCVAPPTIVFNPYVYTGHSLADSVWLNRWIPQLANQSFEIKPASQQVVLK
jgi:hypothetical protein